MSVFFGERTSADDRGCFSSPRSGSSAPRHADARARVGEERDALFGIHGGRKPCWRVGSWRNGGREERGAQAKEGKKKSEEQSSENQFLLPLDKLLSLQKKKTLLAFDVDPRRGGDERRSGDERHRSRPLCSGAFRRRVGAGLLGLVSRRGGFPPGTPWGRLVARKVVKTPLS